VLIEIAISFNIDKSEINRKTDKKVKNGCYKNIWFHYKNMMFLKNRNKLIAHTIH
jgi:UDP-N-acetylglucosamine pyrophosphorylase